MRFIDSHVHLCQYAAIDTLLRGALSCETILLSSGIDKASSLATLTLASQHSHVVSPFVGIHPSEAGREVDLEWILDALAEASGVGEIGLDPKYAEKSPMRDQLRAFEGQVALAEESGKPVQVHSRGAEKECLDVLSSYSLRSVLLHWFQGEGLLGGARDRGYFVSFGPALIQSRKLQGMAASHDPRLVLAETDGPVRFAPLRGASGPSLVPSVVFSLARVWRKSFEESRELVLANSLAYLGAGTKG